MRTVLSFFPLFLFFAPFSLCRELTSGDVNSALEKLTAEETEIISSGRIEETSSSDLNRNDERENKRVGVDEDNDDDDNINTNINNKKAGGVPIGKLIPANVPVEEDGWEFELPEEIAGESLAEIARKKGGTLVSPNPFSSDEQRDAEEKEVLLGLDAEKYSIRIGSSLPESYDFFEKFPQCLPLPRDQKECGGCWAFAATSAASARLCAGMVKQGWPEIPRDFMLSAQKLISCAGTDVAPSGNGCAGAYSEDGAMMIAKMDIPEETCMPFKSQYGSPQTQSCGKSRDCRPTYRSSKVKRLHAVRDRRARVQAIKKEILDNGPVTAIMRIPASFMGYNGKGVYKKTGPWIIDPDLGAEVPALHSVVLVGWGNYPTPHFIGLNSWGESHHKFGPNRGAFFRMSMPDYQYSSSDDHDDTSCWIADVEIMSISVRGSVAPERCMNAFDDGSCVTKRQCEAVGKRFIGNDSASRKIAKGRLCSDESKVCCASEIRELRRKIAEDEKFAKLREGAGRRNGGRKSNSNPSCESLFSDGRCMSVGKCEKQRKRWKRAYCFGGRVCCSSKIR